MFYVFIYIYQSSYVQSFKADDLRFNKILHHQVFQNGGELNKRSNISCCEELLSQIPIKPEMNRNNVLINN